MQFKTDENLPVEVTELLRVAGYDAMSVLEQGMGGGGDPVFDGVCLKEGRILITLDTDSLISECIHLLKRLVMLCFA